MDKRRWLEDPQLIEEVNSCPILPTTLKALKIITNSYLRKNVRPSWRSTHFQYLSIVARILQQTPKFVLSDNTDILIHVPTKRYLGTKLLIKHRYYRFIFEINPYIQDALCLIKIELVDSLALSAHLAEAISEELIGQLHYILLKKTTENQKEIEDVMATKKKFIIQTILKRDKFIAQQLQKQLDCTSNQLTEIIEELSEAGIIGDMGSYYLVTQKE